MIRQSFRELYNNSVPVSEELNTSWAERGRSLSATGGWEQQGLTTRVNEGMEL